VNACEREAVGLLIDALARFDEPERAHAGVAEALCRLARAEGGVLMLGRKFAAPRPGDAADADRGVASARSALALELLPAFGHTNPALAVLPHIVSPVFAVPELVGRAAWENSPYYREFLGPAMDTHAVLGVSFGPAGGMWLGHPDRKRFTRPVRQVVESVVAGVGRGLANLARQRSGIATLRSTGSIDPDAARAAGLSTREVEVLMLLAEGRRHKQVAADLGLSYHTVTTHVRSVFAKLGARGRVEAINVARALSGGPQ
jgi:DNA-binding CsgD family transcriptional regulator